MRSQKDLRTVKKGVNKIENQGENGGRGKGGTPILDLSMVRMFHGDDPHFRSD